MIEATLFSGGVTVSWPCAFVDRRAAATGSCAEQLGDAIAGYQEEADTLGELLATLIDLRKAPPVESMPEIEVCTRGNVGTVKSAGIARELSERATWINGLVSIGAPSPAAGAATWITSEVTRETAERYDEEMSAAQAFAFLQDYNRLRGTEPRRAAIRGLSCVRAQTEVRVDLALASLADRVDRMDDILFDRCNAQERARLHEGGFSAITLLDDHHRLEANTDRAVKSAAPTYTPDLTGCVLPETGVEVTITPGGG